MNQPVGAIFCLSLIGMVACSNAASSDASGGSSSRAGTGASTETAGAASSSGGAGAGSASGGAGNASGGGGAKNASGGSAGMSGSAAASTAGGPTGGAGSGGSAGSAGASAGAGGSSPPPIGRPVQPFGYGHVEQVLAYAASPGMTGEWWCSNHFAANLGGTWSCQSVSGGTACTADVPLNELVSCVQSASRATVDETAFAPPACDSTTLDEAARAFCAGTDYMSTRTQSTLYLYNDWIRVGMNRSYGGILAELYGSDKHNRIEEHGGSAVQMSVWGSDPNSPKPAFFTTQTCNTTPFPDAASCMAQNGGQNCRFFGIGSQTLDCSVAQPCYDWSAAAPWNPIQAQGANCGWNGPSNDVTSVAAVDHGVVLTKVNPYNFTKTNAMPSFTWTTTAVVTPTQPFVELDYTMDYTGSYGLSVSNQEIPAIFTDTRLGSYFYFYDGATGYADFNSAVTRIDAATAQHNQLLLPGRTGQLPQAPPPKYYNAAEEWLSTCDASEQQCLTLAVFSQDAKILSLDGQYITPLGRDTFAGHHAWKIYLFPYRHDDIVAGKTVRAWVYQLKQAASK